MPPPMSNRVEQFTITHLNRYFVPFQNGPPKALLLDGHSVYVDREGLLQAVAAAEKSQSPAQLLGAIIRSVFTTEVLAESRGQGLHSKKENNDRRTTLDNELCQICKG